MKKMIEKISIIAIASLFVSVSITSLIGADPNLEIEPTVPIEISSIQGNGNLQTESLRLTNHELSDILEKLSTLIRLLNIATDESEISNILLNFINENENPILSKLINYLLNSKISFDRKVVISGGWGLNLNPFKKGQTEFVKPITYWHYASQSETLLYPSTTAILSLNPFEFKTITGSQFGLMMRFRGVYIHIPESLPNQSFTFFIGSAKYIMNIELPALQLPEGMMN